MRVADRAARFLSGRLSRRGFVTRSALAGSALAVAPKNFVLRPGTAYAAICTCSGSDCDCGSLCCDGYTEFCCSINGANSCPPGTLMGGWWKVDNSGFCTAGGAAGPRYYMDCNYTCGDCGCGSGGICSRSCAGADCGCHLGCGHRKLGCTGFRYGQCNQDIACIGPILCRVVTCTPPWLVDSSCGTAVRTDNNTRFHHAPCLENGALPAVGSLTRVRWRGGLVEVTGFVQDAPGTTVQLSEGTRVLGRTQADLTAEDVGQSAVAGATWFKASYPLTTGAHVICGSALVVAGQAPLGCIGITVPGDAPIGALDVATGGPGEIHVAGWALDTGSGDPVGVHVYVDGMLAASTAAGGERPDIGDRYPTHAAPTGFDLAVPAGGGSHRVVVFAINQGTGSRNTVLGAATVDVGGGSPAGLLDAVTPVVDGVHVVGWAVDPDTADSIDVHVHVDGEHVASARADRPRVGVGAALPAYGPDHGFDAFVPVAPGPHQVCVYGIDRAGANPNRLIGCANTTVAAAPAGALDSIVVSESTVTLAGWALAPSGSDSVAVTLTVDGIELATKPADLVRLDVAAAFEGRGPNHGYVLTVDLPPGSHEVVLSGGGREIAATVVDVPLVVAKR